ncbi:MAG TPA: NADP oxidoreductase [Lentisphaeria bacterium]|nr:MAG: NADP oxidoreductase [Lentisphaerae bacterium GWF2_38_69]HBM14793.1 NADP oxidoreductase [Lentisphaeria bacterium]
MERIVNLTIDDVGIKGKSGQTIMQAADDNGIYIPRLCAHKELTPYGSCRVCTVIINGRPQSACTQPIAEGMIVENDSERVREIRRDIIDMLFVEGNHYCMFCEKSGNCELQAIAYRLGITAPKYPFMFNKREVDASHPDLMIDHNRCILCARCVRASKDIDGKNIFQFTGRGTHRKLEVNSEANLKDTDAAIVDRAFSICPVGCLIRKRKGFAVPIGQRIYDNKPIGSDIERQHQ